MSKYAIGKESEDADLPNKLGLTNSNDINQEEFVGFTIAEQLAIDALNDETLFTLDYLYMLHASALGHLYDFAGKLRTVNMSKDEFAFPAAQFLPETMAEFEVTFLQKINDVRVHDEEELLNKLAEMHAELLYIHPFREGNGRIARLLTRLIYLAKTGKFLKFEKINEGTNFVRYVAGIQQAAANDYSIMRGLFAELET